MVHCTTVLLGSDCSTSDCTASDYLINEIRHILSDGFGEDLSLCTTNGANTTNTSNSVNVESIKDGVSIVNSMRNSPDRAAAKSANARFFADFAAKDGTDFELNHYITLEIDPGLAGSYRISSNSKHAKLTGSNMEGLYSAVYDFFTLHGVNFTFSGIDYPNPNDNPNPYDNPNSNNNANTNDNPNPKQGIVFKELEINGTPSIKNRGIRMHLNFVQDQSFFSEDEFESFIDNMARLKMNYLCFHMYNSQEWFPFTYRGHQHLTLNLGNLKRRTLSPDMIGRNKVKVKDHWFPREFEDITDPADLLNAVHDRYKRMMQRAKARNMTVALSFEPESISADFEERLKEWSQIDVNNEYSLVNDWQEGWSGNKLTDADIRNPIMTDIAVQRGLAAIDAYEEIDELHLISREGTAWRKSNEESEQEFNRILEKYGAVGAVDFSELLTVVTDTVQKYRSPKVNPYWTVMPGDDFKATVLGSLRFVEYALGILADDRLKNTLNEQKIKPVITIYSPNPGTMRLIKRILPFMIPDDIALHLLADYGAKDISEKLGNWQPLFDAEMEVGMISWLEFDGCMMLAQNWFLSIADNVKKASEKGIDTIYFNHWRVKGLEQNAQAASMAMWQPENPEDMVRKYCVAVFGEKDAPTAISAFRKLEEATIYSKENNFNIGFTNDWVFTHSTDAPGYAWQVLFTSIENYEAAASLFGAISGHKFAEYMRDMCRISALHVKAVYHMQNAKLPLYGYQAWPVDRADKVLPHPDHIKVVMAEAQQALDLEKEYMELFSRHVETCDEQGQLAMHHQGVIEPLEGFIKTLRSWLDDGSNLH